VKKIFNVAVRLAKCPEDWGLGGGVVWTSEIHVQLGKYHVEVMDREDVEREVREAVREQIIQSLFFDKDPVLEVVAELRP